MNDYKSLKQEMSQGCCILSLIGMIIIILIAALLPTYLIWFK